MTIRGKYRASPFVMENPPDPARIEAIARPIAAQMMRDASLPSGHGSLKAMTEYAAALALLLATILDPLDAADEATLRGWHDEIVDGFVRDLRARRED